MTGYGGDALWALVVFLGFGFAFCRSTTVRIALLAVCFAWSVEFLQLYHAPWIDGIRSTLLGRLVLGDTFNSPDLIAYVFGIALGAFAEGISREDRAQYEKCPAVVKVMGRTDSPANQKYLSELIRKLYR